VACCFFATISGAEFGVTICGVPFYVSISCVRFGFVFSGVLFVVMSGVLFGVVVIACCLLS